METSSNGGSDLEGGFAERERGKWDICERDEAYRLQWNTSAIFQEYFAREPLTLYGAKILDALRSLCALPLSFWRFATVPSPSPFSCPCNMLKGVALN